VSFWAANVPDVPEPENPYLAFFEEALGDIPDEIRSWYETDRDGRAVLARNKFGFKIDLGLAGEYAEAVNTATRSRDLLTKIYAWGVPNDAALEALARHAPLVEMGAGTGYWASLLKKRGVDILAFDLCPPGNGRITRNKWTAPYEYLALMTGGPNVLPLFRDRTLFLCWPPYDDPFAETCLDHYEGEKFVFVGEEKGNSTATDAFYDRLDKEFEEVEKVKIPNWIGMRDRLVVYRRR
jgi:hypothetical protein